MNNASYGWPVRAASPSTSASNGADRRPAPEGLPMKRGFDMTVNTGAGTLPRFHPHCAVPAVAEPPAILRTPGPPPIFSSGSLSSGVHPEFADSRVGRTSVGLLGAPLLAKPPNGCNDFSLPSNNSPWPHNQAALHTAHSEATAQEPGAPSRPRPPPVEVRSPPARSTGRESPPPPGRLSFGSALASSSALEEDLHVASDTAAGENGCGAIGVGARMSSSEAGWTVNPFTHTAPEIPTSTALREEQDIIHSKLMSHNTSDRTRPGSAAPPPIGLPQVCVEGQDSFGWSDSDEEKEKETEGWQDLSSHAANGEGNESDSLAGVSDGSFDDDCNDDNGSVSSQSSDESEGCSRQLVWPHAPSPQYHPSVVGGGPNHHNAATTGSSRASSLSGSPLLESALAAAAARSEANAQAAAAGGTALNGGDIPTKSRSIGSSLSSGFGGGWSDDNAGSRGSSLAADSPSRDHIGMQLNSNSSSCNSSSTGGSGFNNPGSLAPLEAATLLTPRSGGVVLRSNNGRESTDPFLHKWPPSTPSPSPATFHASSSIPMTNNIYPNIDGRSRSNSNNSVEHPPSIFSCTISTFGLAGRNNNTYNNNSNSTSGNSSTNGEGQGMYRSSSSNSSLHFTGVGGVLRGSYLATSSSTNGTRSNSAGFMGAAEKESPREEGSFPRRPRLRAAHRFHSPPGSAGSSSSDQLPPLMRPLNPVAATLTELESQDSSDPRPSRLINHFPDPNSMASSSSFESEHSRTGAAPFASLTLSSGLTPREGAADSSGEWSSSGDGTERFHMGANGAGLQNGDMSTWPKIVPKGKVPSPTGLAAAPPPLFGKADSPARFAPNPASSINSNTFSGSRGPSPTPGKPAAVRPIASSFVRSPRVVNSHNWASAAAAMSHDHSVATLASSLPLSTSSPRVGFPSPSGLLNSSNKNGSNILNNSYGTSSSNRGAPSESPISGPSTYAAFSVPTVPVSPTSSASIPGFAFGQPGFGSVNTNIGSNIGNHFNANHGDTAQLPDGATTGFLSGNSHENSGFNGGGFLVPIPIHGFQRMSVTQQPHLGQEKFTNP